ncbi:D-cysteine desulfhydrase family protein [candidate division KSB1 bacterium]|nr:D-cysteine desulfhydrase family protein [candidate division KSB1 bacterium]
MHFKIPPRVPLAQLPTPLQMPRGLNQRVSPHQLYVKRDDLTGCALSGNKVRKLEFIAAEFQAQHSDTVITCGGIQSNHARATAVVAATLGINSHLVLRGQPHESQGGNLFLDRLVGAQFTFITPDEYRDQRDAIMQRIAHELQQQGKHPYIIPEGASNALGAMGYLNAMQEMQEQWQAMGLKIDAIVTAVGSGGTYAGLLLGKFYHHLPCDIIGINVCDDAAYFRQRIFGLIQTVKTQFDLDLGIRPEDIQMLDGYVGIGYAQSRPEELALIHEIARTDGLILDPVYTGKAMYGLLDQLKQGKLANYQNILFLHSGGIFGLFPTASQFTF